MLLLRTHEGRILFAYFVRYIPLSRWSDTYVCRSIPVNHNWKIYLLSWNCNTILYWWSYDFINHLSFNSSTHSARWTCNNRAHFRQLVKLLNSISFHFYSQQALTRIVPNDWRTQWNIDYHLSSINRTNWKAHSQYSLFCHWAVGWKSVIILRGVAVRIYSGVASKIQWVFEGIRDPIGSLHNRIFWFRTVGVIDLFPFFSIIMFPEKQ